MRPIARFALAAALLSSGVSAAQEVEYTDEYGVDYCKLSNEVTLPCDEIGCGKRGDKPCKRLLPKPSTDSNQKFTLQSAVETYSKKIYNNESPLKVTLPKGDFKYQVSLNDDDPIYTIDGHRATDCQAWDRYWYYCVEDKDTLEVSCSWENQYVDLRFALADDEAADVDSPVEYFRDAGGSNKGDQWRFDFRYQFDVLYGGSLVSYPITANQIPSLYAALAGNVVQINMKCHVAFLDDDVSGYMLVEFVPTPYSPSMDELQTFLDESDYAFRTGVRFDFPAFPGFEMPPAVNITSTYTYKEKCLNCADAETNTPKNGFVVLKEASDGSIEKEPVKCTGLKMHYWGEDQWWYDAFLGADGYLYRTTRLFYASDDTSLISSVYRTEWSPMLLELLNGRVLRQTVTCDNTDDTAEVQYLFYGVGDAVNQTDCNYVGGDMFCFSAAVPPLGAGLLLPLLATLAAAVGAWGVMA